MSYPIKIHLSVHKTFSLFFGIAVAALWLAGGCSPRTKHLPETYKTIADDPRRDADAARWQNAAALKLMRQGKYPQAEAALKKALEADVTFGPAHNNLGKAYFQQGQMYLAAWEFQYAAKLMPRQAEPLNNLGLVYESAGKLDEAVDVFDQAMRLDPENSQFAANAARARLRRGDRDERVCQLLEQVVTRDRRPQWVTWAREKLALMGPRPTATTTPTTNATRW